MDTKMTIFITIKGEISSRELYSRLVKYNANVTDMISETYVYAVIDIRDDTIERILEVCKEYGDCKLEAHLIKDKSGGEAK